MAEGDEVGRELAQQDLTALELGTPVTPEAQTAPAGEGIGVQQLPAKQKTAMETLLAGGSVTEAAKNCGVSRTTIYDWLKNDPAFGAAYNRWHEMMEESCRSRLKMMLDKASSALEKALEGGDAKSALQLLKGMGMIRKEEGERSTEVEDVAQERRIERAKRKAKLESEEMFGGFGV